MPLLLSVWYRISKLKKKSEFYGLEKWDNGVQGCHSDWKFRTLYKQRIHREGDENQDSKYEGEFSSNPWLTFDLWMHGEDSKRPFRKQILKE